MKPRHHIAVWGFFFCVYMLSTSREPPWNDASLIYHTAGSIVLRGDLGIPTSQPNVFTYAPHPIMAPLSQVPGFMIYQWVIARWMDAWAMAKVLTTHLGPAFFGALTCSLFLSACLRLGIRIRVASLCTLVVGLCTSVWVYARSPYSEIVQAATYMGYIGALIAFWHSPRKATALRVGFWAALLVNSKIIFVLSLPGGLAICAYRMRRHLKSFGWLLPWALTPLAAAAGVIMLHSQARTGVATSSGYAVTPEIFAQPFWEGAYGLLASPGRSLFLYSPPVILSPLATKWAFANRRFLLVMLALCSIPVFCVYAKFEAWSGDWGWGPRYMLPFLAPMFLPGALWVDHIWGAASKASRTPLRWAIAGLCVVGLIVQLLGNAFYWDHFIRISQEARNGWLGNPNRIGSKGVPRPTSCDPCFEDYYPFEWLPAFQQIEGHWWLLKTVPLHKSWIEATMTAPWTHYTSMQIPIPRSYPQARIDWWPIQFGKKFKTATALIIATLSMFGLACALIWRRRCAAVGREVDMQN
ncbi:MAG: hypothetical protein SF187_19215 [Deltaproteobacteria bacterium]|nr:hypothetical protein [Deltaproteobacteria bacterium]